MTHAANKVLSGVTAAVCLGLAASFLAFCEQREPQRPEREKRDSLSAFCSRFPDLWGDFCFAFRRMHEALKAKRWDETYYWRSAAFKKDVPKGTYLAAMGRHEKDWELVSWEVLDAQGYGAELVRVIVRYVEQPGAITSYNAVIWRREPDGWRCEEAGPAGMTLFRSTRMPEEIADTHEE